MNTHGGNGADKIGCSIRIRTGCVSLSANPDDTAAVGVQTNRVPDTFLLTVYIDTGNGTVIGIGQMPPRVGRWSRRVVAPPTHVVRATTPVRHRAP